MITIGIFIVLVSLSVAMIYGARGLYYILKAEYIKQNREFKAFKKFAKSVDVSLSDILKDDDVILK